MAATLAEFTGGVLAVLLPMPSNCAEDEPRLTLVLLVSDGGLFAGFAIGARAFPSLLGAAGKGLLELSIFTGITFISGSIRLCIGSLTRNFRTTSIL